MIATSPNGRLTDAPNELNGPCRPNLLTLPVAMTSPVEMTLERPRRRDIIRRARVGTQWRVSTPSLARSNRTRSALLLLTGSGSSNQTGTGNDLKTTRWRWAR